MTTTMRQADPLLDKAPPERNLALYVRDPETEKLCRKTGYLR